VWASQERRKITSIEFRNYKAFKHYSLTLQPMSLLVGPHNCGKSTVIDAFKVLSVALRRARAKKPDFVIGPDGRAYGSEVSTDVLAVSLENSHTDYSEDETTITFRLSSGNRLELYFPRGGGCRLLPIPEGKAVATVAAFKAEYPVSVAVVPCSGASNTKNASWKKKPYSETSKRTLHHVTSEITGTTILKTLRCLQAPSKRHGRGCRF
jgi:hypothetical protein